MNSTHAERIHALWDELSDFDVSQSEAATGHLMQSLVALAGVQNAAWAGAVRVGGPDDPLFGWRVAPVKTPDPDVDPDQAHFNVLPAWDGRNIDPCFLLPMRDLGRFRTYSLRRELPAAWFGSSFYRRHYGSAGIYDAVFVASGGQWYYHCHLPPAEAEHGHFHCFVRPGGKDGPVHHLIAVGVDAHGRLQRLFTVNQWVVGDTWLDAEPSIALLDRFDIEMPQPSYLSNRWLSAILRLYADDIATLIRQRDATLAARSAQDTPVREDRTLEVTSELRVDLPATLRALSP